jgi:hypothetical protein
MSEITFPLLGAMFVVLVVLPLSAALAKALLLWLERDDVDGPLHGLTLRYLLLVGSSFLPLAWFVSAGLHQAESGVASLACLWDHYSAQDCQESGYFALALLLVVLTSLVTASGGSHKQIGKGSAAGTALAERIARLVQANPALHYLRGRVVATSQPGLAMGTHGWLRPRVVVGTAFANSLTDDMLVSALGHEREHVRALDPMRFFLLRAALVVNPLGRLLLAPHVARWYAAREAHCDREAVLHGAAPLSLAAAIVRAARPGPTEQVALGALGTDILRFRVDLLLAFAERRPSRCCHQGPSVFPASTVLLVIAVVLPHETGTVALDLLHAGTERLVSLLLH